jgi:hypothetical protein
LRGIAKEKISTITLVERNYRLRLKPVVKSIGERVDAEKYRNKDFLPRFEPIL